MSSWQCDACGHVWHHYERHGAPSMCGSCRSEDSHEVSHCDNCDAPFDPEQDDCQLGHDGPRGYVPSLCPKCLEGGR